MENSIIFKKYQKRCFQNSEIQKIECTVIINTFSQRVVKESSRFSQRHARKAAHNDNKIFFEFLLAGHDPEEAAAKWCPKTRICMNFSENSNVRALPAPPQPKTMRETKYLDPKASHEKKCFFCRKCFSQYFSLF